MSSTNYGANWSSNYIPSKPIDFQIGLACSGSGRRLLTLFDSGLVLTSQDEGVSWTNVLTMPEVQNGSAACSADGMTLAVVACAARSSTIAYVSTNSGANWSQTQLNPFTNINTIASSADGTSLAVALAGAGTYAGERTPSPTLCLVPAGAELRLSWLIPSRKFVLQQKSDLATANWSDISTTPILNYTNLHYEVTVPAAPGATFYRLKAAP